MTTHSTGKIARRAFLGSAAAAAPVILGISAANAAGVHERLTASSGEIDEHLLSPVFVSGTLVEKTAGTLLVFAPLSDGSAVTVRARYNSKTELWSRFSDIASVPLGSRIEVGSPRGSQDRLASWININPVYNHGVVQEVTSEYAILAQDHGGLTRYMHVTAASRLHDGDDWVGASLQNLRSKDYCFFTAFAHTADIGDPHIDMVTCHITSRA